MYLVTNYSMLQFMLMRPFQTSISDATKAWLAANPHEQMMLVLDEAHLYRGAGGSEVALLIRQVVPASRDSAESTTSHLHDREL